MSNYLIKIGNLYYAGTHDFTAEKGYLDKRHPRVLIKLNKFDFNATQFASEKYAREVADKLKFKCTVVRAQGPQETKPDVEYLKSPAVVADALQAIIDEFGERKARELLMVSNRTFDKMLDGRADDVWFRLILNTLKTMINLGRREVQMYINYRKDLAYKVKG
jgi:hypothetical protein